jgi:hypothetical protein
MQSIVIAGSIGALALTGYIISNALKGKPATSEVKVANQLGANHGLLLPEDIATIKRTHAEKDLKTDTTGTKILWKDRWYAVSRQQLEEIGTS